MIENCPKAPITRRDIRIAARNELQSGTVYYDELMLISVFGSDVDG